MLDRLTNSNDFSEFIKDDSNIPSHLHKFNDQDANDDNIEDVTPHVSHILDNVSTVLLASREKSLTPTVAHVIATCSDTRE